MTNARYEEIKRHVALWHIVEPEHCDAPALCEMFIEARRVIEELFNANEAPPTLGERIRAFFRG